MDRQQKGGTFAFRGIPPEDVLIEQTNTLPPVMVAARSKSCRRDPTIAAIACDR